MSLVCFAIFACWNNGEKKYSLKENYIWSFEPDPGYESTVLWVRGPQYVVLSSMAERSDMAAPRRSTRSNQGVLPVRFQDERSISSRLSAGNLSDVESRSSVSRATVGDSSTTSSASSKRRASMLKAELRMARMEKEFLRQQMEQERRIFRLEMEQAAREGADGFSSRSNSPGDGDDDDSGLTFQTCGTRVFPIEAPEPEALASAAMDAGQGSGVVPVERHDGEGEQRVWESNVEHCAQARSSSFVQAGTDPDVCSVRDSSRGADTQLTTRVTGSSVRDSARVHNTVQAAFKPGHKTSSQRPGPSVAQALKFETPAVSAHPQSASRVQDWIDHVQVPAQAGINQHQIKPLELPKFDGLQKSYVRWRQRFMRLVDDDLMVSEDYKMARLREALDGGKAEELISEVLDGPGAYRSALEELEAWYGSSDRELERQQKELMNLPRVVMEKDTESLQRLAVKLRNVIVNMRTAGMQPGRELYISITQKLPRGMLSRYMDTHDDSTSNAQELSQWLMRYVNQSRHVDARLSSSDLQPAQKEQRKLRSLVSNVGQAAESSPAEPTRAASAGPRTAAERKSCFKCRGNHDLPDCSNFVALSVQRRWDLVKLLRLCLLCLKPGHYAKECKTSGCSKCNGSHHRLLHYDRGNKVSRPGDKKQNESCSSACTASTGHTVAFMTVQVAVQGNGTTKQATALLDSGSSASYVTEGLVRRLGLKTEKCCMETTVLGGGTIAGETEKVNLGITSLDSSYAAELEAWVLPKITAAVPPVEWQQQKANWSHLQSLPPMVDPSDTIDLLIGLNAAEMHTSLEERVCPTEGGPTARKTQLGWVLFGPSSPTKSGGNATTLLGISQCRSSAEEVLNDLVKKFWSLEAVGMDLHEPASALTPDERAAEKITSATLSHDGERFEIGIPWCSASQRPEVRSNFELANGRLTSLMRMLERKPEVKLRYTAVLEDYLQKGYIRLLNNVADGKIRSDDQFYLPHFAVVREDKATTKVRIVFDGAAKDGQRPSINELMYAGPKLQNNMVHVLLRFCRDPIALAADISEMFLQVKLRPEDRRYHRFLWKKDGNLVVFEFLRIVFGIKASPYLAGRALLETANKFAHTTSEAAVKTVAADFYVDDLLTSCKSDEQAVELRADVQELLRQGGFHIRKWNSNSAAVIQSVPEADRAANTELAITDRDAGVIPSQKTLGVSWSCQTDCFTFNYAEPQDFELTRRGVLSQMCRLFDPRGQLAPFTIQARVLFQEACIRGTEWDERMDDELTAKWQRWFEDLPELARITIPRCFKDPSSDEPLSLHTFTDASDLAYAAVVYTRQELPDGSARISLAMAKARPSPVRKKTIPMLELQGAVLGVRVAGEVAAALDVPKDRCHFWTDSMNVLFWIRSASRKFKIEVANRVAHIQDESSPGQWQHVPGKLNPADIASRGASAKQLSEAQEWWAGPEYLKKSEEEWPSRQIVVPAELPGQLKRVTSLAANSASLPRLHPDNFSRWSRLKRVTAWCRRFARCASKGKHCVQKVDPSAPEGTLVSVSYHQTKDSPKVSVQPLTVSELQLAEEYWIHHAQKEAFPEAYDDLRHGREVNTCMLKNLKPYLDMESSLMKVGGRLSTAHHLPLSVRNPVILPSKHRVTQLIVKDEDDRCGHVVGANHILSNLALKYWIVKGKSAVKHHRNDCVLCKRTWAKAAHPIMGQLPNYRTSEPLQPFAKVGVDYCGPFYTKQGRGRPQMKRWACVFTCLQVRACHLEMVTSLDTDGFLMAFDRFVKRRGTPVEVVSDNGTNFVAAERLMREAVAALDKAKIKATLADRGVNWHFNPPASPHFGGVFEAIVKSVKRALQTVLHRADITDEEFMTALVHAEAFLNSRPLAIISSDPKDLRPLTPMSFLIGHMDISTALEEDADRKEVAHPRRRWLYVQRLVLEVWRRWLKELVPRMHVRVKWHGDKRKVEVGDVVLVMTKDTPRGKWPLGRVQDVFPGPDDEVRVVNVLVGGKEYRRSVHSLIPLEVNNAVAVSEQLPETTAKALSDLSEP